MSARTGGPAACAIPGTPLALASAGIDACVHCGFCLQACPTYLVLEDENDSPRGRIVLMRALVEGTLATTDADVRTHIDRCLGCRACETACPSGVPYGHLLEATRATLTAEQPNPFIARRSQTHNPARCTCGISVHYRLLVCRTTITKVLRRSYTSCLTPAAASSPAET